MTIDIYSKELLVNRPQEAIDTLVKHFHDAECIATAISDHFKHHCGDIAVCGDATGTEKLIRVKAMLQQNGLEHEYFYARHPLGQNTGYFKDSVEYDSDCADVEKGGLAVRKSAKFILINSENNLSGEPFLAHFYQPNGGFDDKPINTVCELIGYFECNVDGQTIFHIINILEPTIPVVSNLCWSVGVHKLLKLWAISKSQLRTTDGMSIGSMALNIYNVQCDEEFQVCREFVGKCFATTKMIKADAKSLSSHNLVPEYDAETGTLKHRDLQQPQGTCLLVDERQMECGELDATATKNIKALMMIATQQRLQYSFPYCECDIDVDYAVMVVSKEKSLVPCHWRLDYNAIKGCIEELTMMREYVEYKRNQQANIGEETARLIETDVIENKLLIDESKLHSVLTLSRLIAVDNGAIEVTVEEWREAVKLSTSI